MTEFINKTIKIASIEDQEKQIKLKDQDNKTFSFWKELKTGGDTKAYGTFKAMELKSGGVARISYVVEDWKTKEGELRKSSKITSFMEADASEDVTPTQPPQYVAENKPDWDAKDRLHTAQTSANVVGNLDQGKGSEFNTDKADTIYEWLSNKQNDKPLTQGDMLESQAEDVPFN